MPLKYTSVGSAGFWYSDDLLHWDFHADPGLLIYDYAPDVRQVGDYLYFSASRKGRNCPILRTADPLTEPFTEVSAPFAFWDPDMFCDDDGRVYFYWGCSNTSPIWGVELDPETMTPIGEKKELIFGREEELGYERPGNNGIVDKESSVLYKSMKRFYNDNNTGDKSNDRSNAKITDDDILRILQKKGKVKVFEKDFNPFSTGKSEQKNHKERLFLCIVGDNKLNIDFSKEVADTPSPLNYTGGKFRILNQLKTKFPKNIDIFYDIFCGGANVSANIETKTIKGIDKNPQLISLLNYLKSVRYEDLVLELEKKIKYYGLSNTYENGYEFYGCNSVNGVGAFNKVQFLKLRDDYNKSEDRLNVLFLLLIIFSFNNQIRFNNDNNFNLQCKLQL